MVQISNNRRHEIDWLRVLAFLVLIFYHIGMFYVYDWGWHVKSTYQSEFLQNIMLLVNRWRMPLIFLISGFALAAVEQKVSALRLLNLRFVRLFIPLLIGMYFIVPPQTFFQLVQNDNFDGSFWQFYQLYINPNSSSYPDYHHSPLGWVTWNHLWYLAYLWHYTLLYLLFRPLLRKVNWSRLDRRSGAGILFITVTIVLTIINFWLRADHPVTHDLVNDWYNHAASFLIFGLGYWLAKCNNCWVGIIHYRRWFLIGGLIGYASVLILHNGRLDTILTAQGINVDNLASHTMTWIIIYFIRAANVICWLFALLGYSARYLNRPHKYIHYMNEAVLPWYILHQTLIIVFAMWLAQFALGPFWEPFLLTGMTFLGCFFGYELIKRNNFTRFCFGMKLKKSS